MIAIVDYGLGNLHSVRNALTTVGADAIVTRDIDELRRADRIILPGVGAFGECMKNLRELGLVDVLEEEVIRKAKPFLGVCLGMQVLASEGEEGGHFDGLGWIPGVVKRLDVDRTHHLHVPHVGWNAVSVRTREGVFAGLGDDPTFYFVHSYHFVPREERHVAATSRHGVDFVCAVQKDNMVATQFHPEKSQPHGLTLLANFARWKP